MAQTYSNTNGELKKGYIPVDIGRLQMDCKAQMASHKIDTDEISVSGLLEANGISDSTFNNAYHNYIRPARNGNIRNKDIVDKLYFTDDIARPGTILQVCYQAILRIFNLDDIYRLPLRSEVKKEIKPTDNQVQITITKDDISELRTDMRMLTKSIMLLAETIQQNNVRQKPKAILPEKKEVI